MKTPKIGVYKIPKIGVYLLDLKQMNEEEGYSYRYSGDSYQNIAYSLSNTIDKVLFKKSKHGKYEEVLTHELFDAVYSGPDIECSYQNELRQTSKIVHTFVDADSLKIMFEASNEEIENYIKEHDDVETFKEYLVGIKALGEQKAREAIKRDETEYQQKINERKRVRDLLKANTIGNK